MNESTMEEMYKNRLQEYAQKSSIPLPVYKTINEGSSHAPQFRSSLFFDGTHYTSPTTFPKIKQAEKNVAKIACEAILHKPNEDYSFPFLLQDTTLCKSIMVEYAVKMKLEKPTFVTRQARGQIAVFVSDLVLNGVNYAGVIARTKKEAEQLAARAAIMSIMDSESKLVMSKILQSKAKHYALLCSVGVNQEVAGDKVADINGVEMTLNKRKEPAATENMTIVSSSNDGSSAVVDVADSGGLKLACNKRKEPAAPEDMTIVSSSNAGSSADDNVADSGGLKIELNKINEPAAPEDTTIVSSFNVISGAGNNVADNGELKMALREPAASEDMTFVSSFNAGSGALAQPFHEFKKPKVETPSQVIPFPITFVPPGHIPKVEFVACSTAAKKKKNKKKKKKSEEIVGGGTQIADSVMPLVEAPPCSVVQCAGTSV